jgi:hypothetical protein
VRAVGKVESLNSLKILSLVTTMLVDIALYTKNKAKHGVWVALRASGGAATPSAENDDNSKIITMCE